MSGLNVTLMLQGRKPEDQLGHHRAFESAVSEGRIDGYRPFPYRTATNEADWALLWEDVISHMAESGSNVLYLQYFHGRNIPDPRPPLERIRALPRRPIVVSSCGDPFGPFRHEPPASLVRASSMSDAILTTSMGRLARTLERAGGRRITLVANSACDVRFGAIPEPPSDRDFDVVFVGSRPGGRNFTKHLYWAGRRRLGFVNHLTKRYGTRFALYGHGWEGNPSWQGPAPFDGQALVTQRGRVIFGGYPGSTLDYYTSNRVLIQMLSGVPFVDYRVPRIDRLLADSEEWLLFDDIDGATSLIDAVLDGRIDGDQIGRAGAEAVRSRHLNSHRVELVIRIMEELLTARTEGRDAVCPPLDFFHGGVDPAGETMALSRW